jgi:AcrR family transcriptional regulator
MEVLDKILVASAELFSQYGFKTITMDDIARRSGISKKTLYVHFANKEEVVNESIGWYKNNTTNACAAVLDTSKNPVEAMVKMLAFFDDMFKRINPMAMFELQRYYPEAYKSFRDMLMERDVAMMKENLEQGVKEGYYRSDIDAGLLARYRIECSVMILQMNEMVQQHDGLTYVAMEIGEHFMYGIMTPKGVELYKQYKTQYIK